ncbi:hypothetical protein EW146_g321 [Bondarzewia mesenterica]|uniref:RNase III domain-containing protein n=1 Tax=Bondarzewia mesenterica TaxID=1095465 RepID=A0A4S4M950_9AGAM|nr:hypothetical protein EW146_g321 [Bondarzewia mesenterica]
MPPQPLPSQPFERDANSRVAYAHCLRLEQRPAWIHSTALRTKEFAPQVCGRLLGRLMTEAPTPDGHNNVANEIRSCVDLGGTDDDIEERLAELGQWYVNFFLRAFRTNKGKHPAVSHHPSRPSGKPSAEAIVQMLAIAPQDYSTSRRLALERDNYRCVISGRFDTTTRDAMRELDPTWQPPTALTAYTELAHIIPESINANSKNPDGRKACIFLIQTYASNAWTVFDGLGEVKVVDDELNGKGIHCMENVMTMAGPVHTAFDYLKLWLEEDPTTPDCYHIHTLYPEDYASLGIENRVVQLTSTKPVSQYGEEGLALPDPRIIALHAACAKVANMSGAAEYIDAVDRDLDEMKVLAHDGGSADVLAAALMMNADSFVQSSPWPRYAFRPACVYQRLETLDDTALKYIVSIQLWAEFPLWHEGYLARRKDHAVPNAQLVKGAVGKKMYSWIIRSRFSSKKWKPDYIVAAAAVVKEMKEGLIEDEQKEKEEENASGDDERRKKRREKERRKLKQDLSTKALAAVIESLVGATYLHGGFVLGVECDKGFDLGLAWRLIPKRVASMHSGIPTLERFPSHLSMAEEILGYTFTHKALLVEALTHTSYQADLCTISYECVEFLDDSPYASPIDGCGKRALPCIRVWPRTSTEREGIPVWRDRKDVELKMTAKRVYRWQCLLHSSPRLLDDPSIASARWLNDKKTVERALAEDAMYPWSALCSSVRRAARTSCQVALAPRKLVIVLERIVEKDVDVLHPVSRLMIWAAKDDEVEFKIEKGGLVARCTIYLNEMELVACRGVSVDSRSGVSHVRWGIVGALYNTEMRLRNGDSVPPSV